MFNKIDQIDVEECAQLCRRFDAIAVCARDRKTFTTLLEALEQRFWPLEAMPEKLDSE